MSAADLDAHVRRIVRHHFSPETGTPHWLKWAERQGWSPLEEGQGCDDLARMGNFDKAALRDAPHSDWTPIACVGRPFHVFETGGTTGMPTQRLSWDDHRIDYEIFSDQLPAEVFPHHANWLILGPTGPRRLRITMEHLANHRGGCAYHVDLDPRWVRRCIREGRHGVASSYRDHVVDQAVQLLENRTITCVFTTPPLLEALAERIALTHRGIRGVLLGGTSMTPQVLRFLSEEVLDGIPIVPVYGNTLMGLAPSAPVRADNGYEAIYHAPQPRAVLRIVDDSGALVPHGSRGRVELTTLTEELFMPRLLERDTAIRRPPCEAFPWDGVADVRPIATPTGGASEGVY